jgi:3-methyladenine DNA glycosylase AlkD
METSQSAQMALRKLADPKKANFLKRFFKSGQGQYAQGDKLLGVTVPLTRKIAIKYQDLPLGQVFKLLRSPYHEDRLLALLIMVGQFDRSEKPVQNKIYKKYIELASRYVNNWDLVDSSAPYIVGKFLFLRPRGQLIKLAKSKNLWNKRISIVSTMYFIRNGQFEDTIKISSVLLNDSHDLIQKAVGWMLREVGKRSQETLDDFLEAHAKIMPRTMLRYAIEKYPENIRKKYLSKKYE